MKLRLRLIRRNNGQIEALSKGGLIRYAMQDWYRQRTRKRAYNDPIQTGSLQKKKEEKMQLGQGRSFLDHVTSDKLGVEGLAKCSGRALDNDTCGLEGRDLGVCATLAAGDDST